MNNETNLLQQKVAELEAENKKLYAIAEYTSSEARRADAAEAEVAAQEREREALNASWHSRCLRTEMRAETAEATLQAIADLEPLEAESCNPSDLVVPIEWIAATLAKEQSDE